MYIVVKPNKNFNFDFLDIDFPTNNIISHNNTRTLRCVPNIIKTVFTVLVSKRRLLFAKISTFLHQSVSRWIRDEFRTVIFHRKAQRVTQKSAEKQLNTLLLKI